MDAVEINRLEYLELSRKVIKYNREKASYIEKSAKLTKNRKTLSPKCSRFFAAVLASTRQLWKSTEKSNRYKRAQIRNLKLASKRAQDGQGRRDRLQQRGERGCNVTRCRSVIWFCSIRFIQFTLLRCRKLETCELLLLTALYDLTTTRKSLIQVPYNACELNDNECELNESTS